MNFVAQADTVIQTQENLLLWFIVLYCIYYAFIRSIHMDIEFVQVYINLQLHLGYKTTT